MVRKTTKAEKSDQFFHSFITWLIYDRNRPKINIFFSVEEPEEDICNPDDIDSCEFGGMCIVNSEGKPDCQCEDTCSLRINPVCGSDGESYENECYLQLEVCRRRSAINVLHAGECGKPSSFATKPLILNFRICMEKNYTLERLKSPINHLYKITIKEDLL